MTNEDYFDVPAILLQQYDLLARSFQRLSGYEEINYHVECFPGVTEFHPSWNEYVLKIVNEKDSTREGLIEAVVDVMEHVADDGRVVVPRPVKNKQGSNVGYVHTADSRRRKILLLIYIPGRTVCMDKMNMETFMKFCYQVSVTAGKLDNVLKSIIHHPPPALKRDYLAWNLQHLHKAKDKLDVVKNVETRNVCLKVMERLKILCENEVNPNVRKGVIHMDFNIGNFILSDNSSVIGVIDFFDSCSSFSVFDVSIMIAHMIERGFLYNELDPYALVNVALSGFQTEFPLNSSELKFLFYGVLGRFVTLLVLLQADCISCKDTKNHVSDLNLERVENCLVEMWNLGEVEWLSRVQHVQKYKMIGS